LNSAVEYGKVVLFFDNKTYIMKNKEQYHDTDSILRQSAESEGEFFICFPQMALIYADQ
jgi:hypothetical protein